MKSTLGGPHLRTLVSQSGFDGNAGIAPSSPSKRGSNKELIPIFPIILSKPSPIDNPTPFFDEYVELSGQFCASHSRTFVIMFANLIAFENVLLGKAIPPP